MDDPILVVHIPRSQVAAIQAAGQEFLRDPSRRHSSIRDSVAAAIETLDAGEVAADRAVRP